MPQTDLCADFSIFPDNLRLPDLVKIAGYAFQNLDPNTRLMINESGGERGMQFGRDGVEITPIVDVTEVRMRIGVFAAPVEVVARAANGAVVQSQLVTGPGWVDVVASGGTIATITLSRGGNEGILERICICVSVQPCQ